MTSFGIMITKALQEKDMSQSDLARKAGLTAQHVYLLVHHTKTPNIKTVSKICEVLGIDYHEACDRIAEGKEDP